MSAPNRRRPDILIRQYGADTTIRMGRSAAIPLPLAAPQDIRRVVKQFLKKIETVRPDVVEPSITAARDFIRIARQSAYDCFTAKEMERPGPTILGITRAGLACSYRDGRRLSASSQVYE
jgi:hypothetical protein